MMLQMLLKKKKKMEGGSFASDFGKKFTELSNKAAEYVLPKLGIDLNAGKNGSGRKHKKLRF